MKISAFSSIFFIFILASFILFSGLRNQSIDKHSDEIIHLRVTQEIFHSKDYLNPTFSGDLYYNKPPLKMWLAQIPINILGESNLSYRLIDSILGLVFISLVILLSRKLFCSVFPGVIASLILLSSKELIWGAHGFRKGTQDDLLITLVCLSYLFLWDIIKDKSFSIKSSKALIITIGFACLSKSIAGLIPLFTLAVFTLLERTTLKDKICYLLKVGVTSLLIPSFYFIYHCLKSDVAWKKFFYIELYERATKGLHNQGDQLFYLKEIFLKSSFTYPLISISGLLFGLALLIRKRDLRAGFLISTSLLPIILYSIPNSRLPWYIFPSYPSLALLLGWLITEFFLELKRENSALNKAFISLTLLTFTFLFLKRAYTLYSYYSEISIKPPLIIDQLSQHILSNPDLKVFAYPDIPNFTPLVRRRNIDREAFYWTMIEDRLERELSFNKGMIIIKENDLKELQKTYEIKLLFELPKSRVRRDKTLVLDVVKTN